MSRLISHTFFAFAVTALAAAPVLAGKPGGGTTPPPPAPTGKLFFQQAGAVGEMLADGSGKAYIAAPINGSPAEIRHGGRRWWITLEDIDPTNADAYDQEIIAYGEADGDLVRVQVTSIYPTYRFAYQNLPRWSGRKNETGTRTADVFLSVYGGLGFDGDQPTPAAEKCIFRFWVSGEQLAAISSDNPWNPVTADDPRGELLFRKAYAAAGGYPTDFSWSPDGRSIVHSDGIPDATSDGIAVLSENSTLDNTVPIVWMYVSNNPRWSPDGTRIAFEGIDVATAQGRSGTWVMSSDGSNLTLVNDKRGFAHAQPWSPDGNWLAVQTTTTAKGRTNADIFRFPATVGGTAINLTSDIADVDSLVGWVVEP